MLDQLRHEEGEVPFNAAKPNFPPHPFSNLPFLLSFVPGLHSQSHYTRVQINSTTTLGTLLILAQLGTVCLSKLKIPRHELFNPTGSGRIWRRYVPHFLNYKGRISSRDILAILYA